MVACRGRFGYVEVTSASSLTFASMVSMVNNTRIREGKKGFSESVTVLRGFPENMCLQSVDPRIGATPCIIT